MSKLITYAYFREETDISQIVDDAKLDNPIKNACDRLRALIGPGLYLELLGQYTSVPKTFSVANTALYDPFIKQFVAWNAYQFYIVKANTYETRTGIRTFNEENSTPATDKIMGEQITLAKNQAAMYRDMLLNFLNGAQRANSSAYPLYKNKICVPSGNSWGFSGPAGQTDVRYTIQNSIANQEP